MSRLLPLIFVASLLTAGGCYKIDIQQGNDYEPELVEKLSPGMSKTQVRQLLGTPLVIDPFHGDRWDYVYTFYPRASEADGEQRRFSLFFKGESLERIDRPAEAALASQ